MKKFLINIYLGFLRFCAKVQLLKTKPLIIGVSGSAGKTTTMKALYAILKDYKKVKYSKKANSETGIPLDILGIHPETFSIFEWFIIPFLCIFNLLTNWKRYDIYIVEMGVDSIDEPKNMKYLLKILVPDICIYLNVNAVHSANYEYLLKSKTFIKDASSEEFLRKVKDLIAEDKNLLVKALPVKGLAVLNMDDPRVSKSKILSKAKVYEIHEGRHPKHADSNEFYIQSIDNENGFSFWFWNLDLYKVKFPEFLLPEHFAISFTSALAVARFLDINLRDAIASLIKNFEMDPGRSSIIDGIGGSLIIDSSWN